MDVGDETGTTVRTWLPSRLQEPVSEFTIREVRKLPGIPPPRHDLYEGCLLRVQVMAEVPGYGRNDRIKEELPLSPTIL